MRNGSRNCWPLETDTSFIPKISLSSHDNGPKQFRCVYSFCSGNVSIASVLDNCIFEHRVFPFPLQGFSRFFFFLLWIFDSCNFCVAVKWALRQAYLQQVSFPSDTRQRDSNRFKGALSYENNRLSKLHSRSPLKLQPCAFLSQADLHGQ